jgi:hypothetical protein
MPKGASFVAVLNVLNIPNRVFSSWTLKARLPRSVMAERAHEGGVEVTTLYRWARAFRATGLLSPLRVRQSAAWARWLDGARLASAAAWAAAAAPQPPRRF